MVAIINNYKKIFSSDTEKVLTLSSEAQRAIEADSDNRNRSYMNWKNYFAVDGSQWPDHIRNKLLQNNKHAAQYNIIGPKVDALCGSLLQEKFDLDWKPIEGPRNSLTEAVKASYYSDSELCDYERNVESVIRDGLIYEGNLKVGISYKNNPFGNISFKRITPGFLVKDPYWLSDDDEDLERAYEIFHLHPEEIIEKFGVITPELEQAVQFLKRGGINYEKFSRDPNVLIEQPLIGHLIRVIEVHWMKSEETVRLVGREMKTERWTPFPITDEKERLYDYMIKNKIDPLTIIESEHYEKVHHVTTIAPEAIPYQVLENGVSKVQCGRLPYISFTSNRAYGQSKGVVDDLIDIQQTINKRESKLTDMIATAQGGGKLVNKDLFDGPLQMQRFRDNANDPSYIEFVDGNELSKEKVMHYINSNQYPSQIVDQLMRMWDIVDRISKVPAALEAISENANESGILFQKKLAAARLNTITIVNRIRDMRKSMAECYYEQFQSFYNGPIRDFQTKDGKYKTILNQRVYNQENGKIYIRNRPDQIPRCHVIATESQSSPNRTLRDQSLFSQMYNLAVERKEEEYATFFYKKLVQTLDLDEEEKSELNEIAAMKQLRAKIKLKSDIDVLLSQSSQAKYAGVQAQLGVAQLLEKLNPQRQELPNAEVPEESIEAPDQDYEELPNFEDEIGSELVSDEA